MWLSLNVPWRLVFYISPHECTISNVIGINEEKRNMSAKQGINK